MRFIVSMLFSIMIFNYHVFGGDLDTKSLVGKWKVSGGKGQKLQVMFNLEQDSLVLSVKLKMTLFGDRIYNFKLKNDMSRITIYFNNRYIFLLKNK